MMYCYIDDEYTEVPIDGSTNDLYDAALRDHKYPLFYSLVDEDNALIERDLDLRNTSLSCECKLAVIQTTSIDEYNEENKDVSLCDMVYQTPELCLAAVRHRSFAIMSVKEQTPEICLVAVRQYGYALKHVKEQTPEICLAAVKENGLALKHVKEQTPEICLAAN